MKIESRTGKSEKGAGQIYEFITDFRNFRELLPADKVTGWEATAERCSFHVSPVGRTGLEIVEKNPHTLVKIVSVPEISNYQFTIWIQLKEISDRDTRIRITIEPQVNKMLLPMIRGPLQQFADGMVEKMEGFSYTSNT